MTETAFAGDSEDIGGLQHLCRFWVLKKAAPALD
jgi:hypothetical protein